MAILSLRGNRKLPRSIAIFNLPRLKTCRWITKLCRKICYARKAEWKFFYRTLPQRKRNYRLSLRKDFVDIMIEELSHIRKKKMRIHESGDFYSQEYLDKWIKIINHFPERTFVVYTKSMLDFSKKPHNLIVFFSLDKTTPRGRVEWYKRNPYKNALAFIDNEKVDCPGSCKICDRCYDKETVRNVYFHKH